MRKNGCVAVGDTDMYYVAFGEGKKTLVVSELIIFDGLFEEDKNFYNKVLDCCEATQGET